LVWETELEQKSTFDIADIEIAEEISGYTFKGWYKDGLKYKHNFPITINGWTNIWGIYELNEFTIIYELNGGENSGNNPISFTVEEAIILEDAKHVVYEFDGWYDENGKKVTEISKGTSENIKLTVKWIKPESNNSDCINIIEYLIKNTNEEGAIAYKYFAERVGNVSITSTGKNFGQPINKEMYEYFNLNEEVKYTWKIEKMRMNMYIIV